MKVLLSVLLSITFMTPVVTIAADNKPEAQTVEKKIKKKHHKYTATKIPEKVTKK